MIFSTLKKFGIKNKWVRSKSLIAGYKNNYLVNMGDGSGYKYILFSSLIIPNELVDTIKDYILESKKEYNIYQCSIDENSIEVSIREQIFPAKIDKIIKLLNFVISVLEAKNIPINNFCHECKSQDHNLYYTNKDDINISLCRSCAEKIRHELNRENNLFEIEDKNYLNGILGAIIYSLPILLIWVVLAVFFNLIAAVAALILVYASLIGYYKFGGKPSKAQKWILLFLNAVIIILANYLTIGIFIFSEGVPAEQILHMLINNDNIIEALIRNLKISFIFSLIPWSLIIIITYFQTRSKILFQSKALIE